MAMLGYTIKDFRGQLRQLVLTGAAVAVGVAFLVLAVGGSGALVDAFSQQAAAEVGPASLQVTPRDGGRLPTDAVARAKRVPGVTQALPRELGQGSVLSDAGRPLDDQAMVTSVAADPGLRWQRLADGAWPVRAGEVLLDSDTAERIDAKPGTRVSLLKADGSTGTALLTGTLDTRGSNIFYGPVIGVPTAFVSSYAAEPRAYQLDLAAALGTSAKDIEAALGDNVRVQTRADAVTEAVESTRTMYATVLVAALSFVLIAMAVARMVVSNTFSVVLAQRTRQLALLRCVGASQQQLRRTIGVQGLLLGAGASAAGLAVGAGMCAAGSAALSLVDLGPVDVSLLPGVLTFMLAWLFGVLLTLLAVRGPAQAAAKVPPVAALGVTHVLGATTPARRLLHEAVSVLMLAFGALMLTVGARDTPPVSLLAATVGAIASGFGVLRLARWVLPPVVALLGVPARRVFGTTGKLAAQQLRRNPGRTSAAASALLVGVTVMVSAATALGMISNSLEDLLAGREPGAFSLEVDSGAVPSGALKKLRQERELTVTEVRSATVRIGGKDTVVVSADPKLLNSSADGVKQARTLKDGDALSNNGPAVAAGLHIRPEDSPLASALLPQATMYVNSATLDGLAPRGTSVATAWIGAASGTSHQDARKALDRALADFPKLRVNDSAAKVQAFRTVFDRMIQVGAVLLGFSMAIAALGVAATLALSVTERTREIGMLRAIGMTGDQLRRMLSLEAVLLALTGTVVGTALGLVFGRVGGLAVTGMHTAFDPPLGLLTALLAVTVLIGLAAAVAPARRVRRLAIVRALTAE
ncbi:ABC transporter permease [Streptomyces sp. NPDC006283]|uniref:ABC transporter permease n=1 Tax=Streptomyces sp. NPDC006283 TaxID=3156741 RepID=UPI0033B5327F